MSNRVTQMYEHALNPVKGWWDLHALDKQAPLAAAILAAATAVPAGRVAHLNDDGEFELGGSGTQMPLFLFQGRGSYDVTNDGVSPVSGVANWFAIGQSGVMNALVATGGYELQTTEFNTALTYLPNQLLTASAAGVLTNAAVTQYTTWVCGVTSWFVNAPEQPVAAVSGPVGTNSLGVSVLTFWSYFLPASA